MAESLVKHDDICGTESVITWREVLALTRVSRSTIRRYVAGGRFPAPIANWPGRRWCWSRSEVRAYFDGLTKPGGEE
jgi:excisionase family DNA binding protein